MPAVFNILTRLQTPKGLRLHIGLFGRRNAGKSSLMNALTHQHISIVSDVPGTTTDPVEKACELAPIGPVVFIDTAGIDDVGELGQQRVARSYSLLEWMDLALVVCGTESISDYEKQILVDAQANGTPTLLVFNKIDLHTPTVNDISFAQQHHIVFVQTCAATQQGIDELREAIIAAVSRDVCADKPMFEGLINPGSTVLLVTPIDTGAPKGRMIMPQVQAIRETLDRDAKCLVVRENRVAEAIANEKVPPAFVVTDSQAVRAVCKQVPLSIPITTFSIQMCCSKSDLIEMARGAAMLSFLKPGDKVMICETCSHHPQLDDIGRKKIPRWLGEKVGGPLDIEVVVGKDFPCDLSPYKIILQCGGCVVTRRHMLARVRAAMQQHVSMTNYGVAISFLQGVLPRALALHPQALTAYRDEVKKLTAIWGNPTIKPAC